MPIPFLRSIPGFSAPLLLVTLALATLVDAGHTATPGRYTVREAMIPMRDGVHLYTQIFEPVERDAPSPILMMRTPYGIGDRPLASAAPTIGPSPLFAAADYILVQQDVRGQFRSEGTWRMWLPPRVDPTDPTAVDESTDAFDTIEWLLEHVEDHNGRVGMWGISYPGWQTTMAMADAHPALRAVSPQASPGDEFLGDDLHHNGAFRLTYSYAWIGYMGVMRGDLDRVLIGPTLTTDAYEFFLREGSAAALQEKYLKASPGWQDVLDHPDYDEYWQQRNVLRVLDDVRPAVLNVAGWFDAEDFRGPIDIYHRVEERDDLDQNFLVIGPWRHGGWNLQTGDTGASFGDLDFGEATSEEYREEVEIAFFEHHLREDGDPLLPEAFAFETGGNQWREFDQWPPEFVEPRSLYLHPAGHASFEAPTNDDSATAFVSDPADPAPYTQQGPVFPDAEYMVEDQRFLDGRPDVLSFLTPPLEEDLVLAGRAPVELYFTTTGTDADWIVKLIDVYPVDTSEVSAATGESMAGAQPLLVGDIFRARYRTGFDTPTAVVPGEVTPLRFELPDRLHRFRAGHRILVQIHSTWFPMYDRNPQEFVDIYHCDPAAFQPADHQVLHQQGAATRIVLPVLPD